ncbi:MAG: hypothetical protein LAT83_09795 [Kiritimatiellae bacterium]|nr:hypothetical protein [Kiritimatiellia bacterium]
MTLQFHAQPLALCLCLTFFAPHALGQTSVNMITNITTTTYNGQQYQSIKQSGTGTSSSATAISFGFQKLDSVANGTFAGKELVAVRVTHRYVSSEDITISVTNTGTETHTFGVNDFIRVNLTAPTWNWQLGGNSLIEGIVFPSVNYIVQQNDFSKLHGLTLAPIAPSQTLSETFTVGVEKSGEVFHDATYDFKNLYEGQGLWDFVVRTETAYTTNVTGSNLDVQYNLPGGTYFTEVEYIVIPELSSLVLMAIAGISVGFFVWKRKIFGVL